MPEYYGVVSTHWVARERYAFTIPFMTLANRFLQLTLSLTACTSSETSEMP
jgi:hypothetical protein